MLKALTPDKARQVADLAMKLQTAARRLAKKHGVGSLIVVGDPSTRRWLVESSNSDEQADLRRCLLAMPKEQICELNRSRGARYLMARPCTRLTPPTGHRQISVPMPTNHQLLHG